MYGFLRRLMGKLDPSAQVIVTLSPIGKIQILIESEIFRPLSNKERSNLIWPELDQKFGNAVTAISICLLRPPEGQLIADEEEGKVTLWSHSFGQYLSAPGKVFSIDARQESVSKDSEYFLFYFIVHNPELGYHTFKTLVEKESVHDDEEKAQALVCENVLNDVKERLDGADDDGIPLTISGGKSAGYTLI